MRRWIHWLPGIETLRRYEAAWLPRDVFAGLVLATMLVPVGIAYAAASGLPGIYGLYATIVPLLVYAVFGPSRILVLGPDSALAAVILGVVVPLSGGDPLRAATLAAMMAIVSGTVCILAGITRLGFVTELLSKPIRYGYMNGIALTVSISQLPKLFGLPMPADGFDAAFCMGNSFGYLDLAGTRAFVAALAAAVRPCGGLVIDYSAAAESVLPGYTGEDRTMRAGDITVAATTAYDVARSRLVSGYRFTRGREEVAVTALHHVLTCAQIDDLLVEAGFVDVAHYAGPDGAAFRLGAPRLLLTARRGPAMPPA